MLGDDLKAQIQGAYRQFLNSKSLKPRLGQRLMIAHIARVLGGIKRNQEHLRSGGDHLCVVEAGTGTGKTLAYALYNLQDRGRLFLGHGVDVYEGQIIGIHSRSNDLTVNPTKAKQLTNVRAAGTDEALTLTPPIKHTLEQALEFIEDDELVEVTPVSIRLRKKLLTENERKRAKK